MQHRDPCGLSPTTACEQRWAWAAVWTTAIQGRRPLLASSGFPQPALAELKPVTGESQKTTVLDLGAGSLCPREASAAAAARQALPIRLVIAGLSRFSCSFGQLYPLSLHILAS